MIRVHSPLRLAILLAALSTISANSAYRTRSTSLFPLKSNDSQHFPVTTTSNFQKSILGIRGGASRKKPRKSKSASLHSTSSSSKKKTATGKKAVGSDEKESAVSSSLNRYKSILPLTRFYISLVGVVTLISVLLGEEATQGLLALDPIRTFNGMELWRPFTAASFFGPPSIGWLMNGYYLFEYGSSLERAFGTPQHIIFLLGQVVLLTMFSAILGQPFYGASMTTSMLHVLSRSMPNQKVKWLIFTVPYWTLPYGLMASDVLQAQSAMSAIPHIMGILSGHFYYFHKFVWPKLGGEDWLNPPDFLVKKFDPDAKKAKINAALKSKRKRGKGRRLGA